MMDILQELKNMVYGYESDFNGKIISKGVIENDERKNADTKKRN